MCIKFNGLPAGSFIKDDGLQVLQKLSLQTFAITFAPLITDNGLMAFSRMEHLRN